MIRHKNIHIWAGLLLCLSITACDTTSTLSEDLSPVAPDEFGVDVPVDPLEDFSRAMMELNFFLDDYLLQPAATTYKALTPEIVQTGVGNFTQYIKIPFYMVNDILQWRWDRFSQNFWVMTINTFSGIGLIDGAGWFNVYAKPNDFGITLHRWGAGSGFSVSLPILGPTCLRDIVGSTVGFFADPVSVIANYNDYRWVNYTVTGIGYIHSRSLYLGHLESLRKESYDPYVTIKSIVEQKRESELRENE